ncbi:hypothetical protein J8M21_16150 [Pseudoalteromonas luteoviolacea]|uniref:hypothetical protein n=1 Tax=Pseudoalteromonas luteoviolacea TaxID=43657 RepID=UPI001B3A635D|nr:hypothetical protein [Pseudoalteromonas luteoviolacea]MBQ4878750.1 hypothetical protein [Pseudoalteromonas luteoviolacea]MBQ4907842.1 hypothetical protein [Pseudoalteromonas luteoviolacea]
MRLFNQSKLIHGLLCLLLSFSASAHIKIQSKLENEQGWQNRNAVMLPSGDVVDLRVEAPEGAQIKWFQIIPDTSQYYKNANHPWEPKPYQWSGFGKIHYQKKHLEQFDDKQHITVSPAWLKHNNVFNSPYYQSDAGSFWFEVEVIDKDGRKLKSVGLNNNDHRGLNKRVLRVSFTQGDGYLGILSSFFNVPAIFGSVPYQSQHYLGVDCADVLMAANAIKRNGKVYDRNVAWLVTNLRHKAKLVEFSGESTRLRWGKDISPGDFIAVRYRKNGQFAHIGALNKDSNRNGILDGEDSVMHAGPNALSYATLQEAGFLGEVVILDNQN